MFPFVANDNLGVGAVCQIPEEAAYEYRPRRFYEAEYPDIPYPEGVSTEDDWSIWWHSGRLTEEEGKEIYGGDEEWKM